MDVTLVVLGAGQDGGSPQVGKATGVGARRTASSIAVAVEDGPLVLFDATPDLRVQDARLRTHGYATMAANPYDAVCITHAHMGHYCGLVHFGKEAAATSNMPLVAHPTVIEYLGSNQPWKALFDDLRVAPKPTGAEPFEVGPLRIEGIEVPHRGEFGRTVGFSIAVHGEPWVFYVPDIDSWERWPTAGEVLARHRVNLLDGTFGAPDELPGRDLSTVPHPLVGDTIRMFSDLTRNRRMILTHINHSNRVSEAGSDLSVAAARAGFEVAHDGLTIRWDR